MNISKDPLCLIKIGLVIGLLPSLAGCAGFGGGVYYEDAVPAQEPDMYIFGGEYDREHDAQNYSRRGYESRSTTHPGASHAAAYSSGSSGTAHHKDDGSKKG